MLQYAPVLPALGIALFFLAAMVIRTGPIFWCMMAASSILLGAGLIVGSIALVNGLAMYGVMALVLSAAGLMILGHPFISKH